MQSHKLAMKQLHGGGGGVKTECFPAVWDMAAKPCGYCKSAAALLFCRAHSGFMCMACDAKLHNAAAEIAAPMMKHERVWMCEVCEKAPASVTCKADAAVLCCTCDRDIHSANPLARRHDRVPVVPFYDTAASMVIMKPTDAAATTPSPISGSTDFNGYISPDPFPIITSKLPADNLYTKSADFLFSDDSDQFVSFENYQIYSDSVVPVGITTIKPPRVQAKLAHQHSPENRFEIDFTRSNITCYYNNNSSTTTASHSHSVSSSSIEAAIVQDGNAIPETSYPFTRSTNYLTSTNEASPVVGMNREARVLRYKEKRKNRKFEKTIRYASRKAYAENRPRIKGRFAKRTEFESDIDEIFSSGGGGGNFLAEARYGVVPSF